MFSPSSCLRRSLVALSALSLGKTSLLPPLVLINLSGYHWRTRDELVTLDSLSLSLSLLCRSSSVMGRATRWLRSLLGRKKDPKVHKDNASTNGYEMKDRMRWSFARPRQAESMCSSPVSATEAAWLRSFYDDTEEESKHAMAVAVATAAAANVAATAAQAAMVRLKSLGREGTTPRSSCQWWAAVKIQTAFRCHLVRLNLVVFANTILLSSSFLEACHWTGKESSSSTQRLGEAAGSGKRLPREKASSHNPPQTTSSRKSSSCCYASRSSCSAPAKSKIRCRILPSDILCKTESSKHIYASSSINKRHHLCSFFFAGKVR